MKAVLLVLALVPALFAPPLQAGGPGAGLAVTDGWVRALPPVARNSSAYLRIENSGEEADELIGARVAGVRVTEMHEMRRDADGNLSMHRRTAVTVPAGGVVSLAPGGLHLMLIDLQSPLKAGETREAVLRFRRSGEMRVVLEVRAP